MRKLIALLLPLSALLLFPAVQAHALVLIINNNTYTPNGGLPLALVSANPSDRQVLNEAPDGITLSFSAPVLIGKSFIRVYGPQGNQLETGELLATEKTLSVTLPASELTSGKYSVKWLAECNCSDNTQVRGYIRFTIK